MRRHLEGLNKGPQQDANGVALPEQFDEASSSEQSQEAQVQQSVLLDKGEIGEDNQNILLRVYCYSTDHNISVINDQLLTCCTYLTLTIIADKYGKKERATCRRGRELQCLA